MTILSVTKTVYIENTFVCVIVVLTLVVFISHLL